MFVKLNTDSTINKDDYFKKKKRRIKRDDIEIIVIDPETGKKSTKIISRNELGQSNKGEINSDSKKEDESTLDIKESEDIQIENKSEEIKQNKPVLNYHDIPIELRSTPMGILLASYAADTGELPDIDDNGQYDWSPVIERYRKLSEQNDNEILQT